MKGSVTKCDGCGKQEIRYEGVFGGNTSVARWITISRVTSISGDKIGSGTSHFCSDKCLASKFGFNDIAAPDPLPEFR